MSHLMVDLKLYSQKLKYCGKLFCKVGCVFPMIIVSLLSHVEFGPNHLVQMAIKKTQPTLQNNFAVQKLCTSKLVSKMYYKMAEIDPFFVGKYFPTIF